MKKREAWDSTPTPRAPHQDTGSRRSDLPAARLQDHRRHGAQHDLEVLGEALATQVLEIVAHLRTHIVEAAVVLLVDLRQAGDPGLHPLAIWILANVLAQ